MLNKCGWIIRGHRGPSWEDSESITYFNIWFYCLSCIALCSRQFLGCQSGAQLVVWLHNEKLRRRLAVTNQITVHCMTCNQKVPWLFPLQTNKEWHGHAHAAGTEESSNFHESVYHVALHCQHQHMCYTCFCDHVQALIRNFTVDLKVRPHSSNLAWMNETSRMIRTEYG